MREVSKQSYEHTEMIGRLRFVEDSGPIGPIELLTEFRREFVTGLIDSQGFITEAGRRKLAESEDRGH